MDRGYASPGVDIFRSEEIAMPNTSGQVIYGIVGPAAKGPYGYQEITSIRMLHNKYGYAYLGEDADGNRVLSDAIIAAEHALSYAKKIVFTRVKLSDAEDAKFTRSTSGKLQFTIADRDATVKSITASSDGVTCTVVVERVKVDGTLEKKQLCAVTTEEDLKKALEYEGTLTDVTVPAGYISSLRPTPAKYEFESYPNASANPSDMYGTGEVELVSRTSTTTTVKVTKNVDPSGTTIPGFVGNEYYVNGVTFTAGAIYELFNTDGTSANVWVKVTSEVPGSANDDVYVPNIDLFDINLTDEIGAYGNRDAVNVQVLAAPMGSVIELGCADLAAKIAKYEVINSKLLETVRSRGADKQSGDCMALFDYPKGLKYKDAYNLFTSAWYRGIDEMNLAIAYPAVTVNSIYTPDIVELCNSAIWLDRMAYTDTNFYPWYAPAGYGNSKGVIPGVISVNEVLDKDKRDDLYAIKINPIVKFIGKGVVLFGNRTFKAGTPYEDPSLFEKVNVVRLANYITRVAYDVSLNVLFEPNDKTTWNQWTARMTTEMEKIKTNRGVEAYKVKMDEETVSDEDLLMGRAPAFIYILPIGAIEYIPIYLTLTNNRAIFGEEV